MRYKHYFPRQLGWSLPACLQSILKLRRFYEPSQEEIAEKLEINEQGFLGNFELLKEFLEKYAFFCEYKNPLSFNSISLDILLETELNDSTDVLACYPINKEENNFSIVEGYKHRERKIIVLNPYKREQVKIDEEFFFGLADEITGLNAHGFYIIS